MSSEVAPAAAMAGGQELRWRHKRRLRRALGCWKSRARTAMRQLVDLRDELDEVLGMS